MAFLYPIVELQVGGVSPEHKVLFTKEETKEETFATSINLIDRIDKSWYRIFLDERFRVNDRLREMFINSYKFGFSVRPLPIDVLNVFKMPVEKINVVIVGQDPYPGWDKETNKPIANGMSFATESKETPGSLGRILDSIEKNIGQLSVVDKERPNSLQGWINQGVFLLNNIPIVNIPKVNPDLESTSFKVKYAIRQPARVWETLTIEICKYILSVNPRCQFILVGSEASKLKQYISNYFITTHPSYRSSLDFTGKCFVDIPNINWQII
jgi:uracil DNA glycosylase